MQEADHTVWCITLTLNKPQQHWLCGVFYGDIQKDLGRTRLRQEEIDRGREALVGR